MSKTSEIFKKHKFNLYSNIISRPETLKYKLDTADNNNNNLPDDFYEDLSELLQSINSYPMYVMKKKPSKKEEEIDQSTIFGKILNLNIKSKKTDANVLQNKISVLTGTLEIEKGKKYSFLDNNPMQRVIFSNIQLSTSNGGEGKLDAGTGIWTSKEDKVEKDKPNLSAIQILDPNLRQCLKNSQELSLFFNSISSIDMSLSMPFIKMKMYIPSTYTVSGSSSNSTRSYTIGSFNEFAFGSESSTMDTINRDNVARALDSDFYRSSYEFKRPIKNDILKNEPDPNTSTSTSPFPAEKIKLERRLVDLNMFTMPQSLVNGDEKNVGPSEEFPDSKKQPIFDKFRPLMTIENISFDVRPTRELMSFKTATMTLILHDKSRLNEVLAFVKQDLFGPYGSEIVLEYGWSNVLGDPDYTNELSPMGEFINSLRCREKYKIVNSSYDIQENGQVNISLNISMMGMNEIRGTKFNYDFDTYIIDKQMQGLISSISNAQLSITDKNKKDIAFEMTSEHRAFLENPASSNLTSLKTKITNNVTSILSSISSPTMRNRITSWKNSLLSSIDKLSNRSKTIQRKIKEELESNILAFLENEYTDLNTMPFLCNDPWGKIFWRDYYGNNKIKDYIPLGVIISATLGKMTACTYQYNEVQMIFYNLNEKAIRARKLNIASIPVNKKDFKTWFVERITTTRQISIEGLVNLIFQRYVGERAAEIYGLNDFLELTENSESSYRFANKRNQRQKQATANQTKEYEAGILTTIAEQYYGKNYQKELDKDPYEFDLTFKVPNIRMNFEAMPVNDYSDETILRINFYDENDNPFESLFEILGNLQNTNVKSAVSTINYLCTEYQNQNSADLKASENYNKRVLATINSLLRNKIVQISDGKGNLITSVNNIGEFDRLVQGSNNIKIMTTNDFAKSTKNLKLLFKDLVPSFTFGATNSAVISANVSSMNDPLLSTVFMTRDEEAAAKNAKFQIFEDLNLVPIRIIPSQVSAKIIGCPLINFGQMFFFDFNTGTTIDNCYVVTGIKHNLSPGKFETDLTLTLADSYAKFVASASTIKTFIQMKNIFDQNQKQKNKHQRTIDTSTAAKEDLKEKIKNTKGMYLIKISFT